MGDYPASGEGMVITYLLRDIFTQSSRISKLAFLDGLELCSEREQTARHQPLRKHVPRSVVQQHLIRNLTHLLLQFLQIGSPAVFSL